MGSYLSENEARDVIVDMGKRVYMKGFVGANDGNISCRIADDTILVTPTGVSKGFMRPEMLVKMKVTGEVLGEGKPSSETKMHLRAYTESSEINAVVHVHPQVATAFSVIGLPLDHPVVAEGVLVTGNILIAPYAKPGTYDVPDGIAPFVKKYNGVLLESHGALTWGMNLEQAVYRMEALEHHAHILLYSMILAQLTGRKIRGFTKDECADLVSIRESMGVKTGGVPKEWTS
ncbi:class II aldolase/adducin N-terminal domain protein [Treponema socranskii subsp. socranskii VPI DR56BR1116 = ATCC 35536]|uniref:Class II aldolase/adducin N-terminal domain protein n=1 Tax=Treponema socranskii subsp. socranskii VPI DR56BR1116 = ATCC 35536 TaxID=1125725 RepID=U1FM88_TRESO|nr:class II aldolase/adducin family protein [Treponema socranskii]ERF60551.1 class II aldolase/adducin N-terminal domain protein [Treponema socranskii subsp. socranskii VPI DR56BR1116 = ATCC 35536]ERK03183.1 class II aldolase/adducin N-terminal domain protein [Treponema socranskii subsp. socranskii VPI DR56BR1116 = ATCC 35536]